MRHSEQLRVAAKYVRVGDRIAGAVVTRVVKSLAVHVALDTDGTLTLPPDHPIEVTRDVASGRSQANEEER